MAPGMKPCDVMKKQYRIARDCKDNRWIEEARQETSTILCSERWVDENIPSLISKPRAQRKRRPSVTLSSSISSGMCVDFRLRSNPNLEVVRENAMDGSSSTTEVPVTESSCDPPSSAIWYRRNHPSCTMVWRR